MNFAAFIISKMNRIMMQPSELESLLIPSLLLFCTFIEKGCLGWDVASMMMTTGSNIILFPKKLHTYTTKGRYPKT